MLLDIGPGRVNPFNAGTVFRRSILTSKNDPNTEKSLNIYTGRRPIAIQMKQKELYLRHLWWFQIEKNTFGVHGLHKNISAL